MGGIFEPAVAVAGGSMMLLASITATGASSVDFSNSFSAAYDDYIMSFNGVGGCNAQAQICIGGVAQIPAGSCTFGGTYQSGGALSTAGSTTTQFPLFFACAAAANYNGRLYIAGTQEHGTGFDCVLNSSATGAAPFGSMHLYGQSFVDGVKSGFVLIPQSGTITGTFRLYGIKKT